MKHKCTRRDTSAVTKKGSGEQGKGGVARKIHVRGAVKGDGMQY